MDPLNPVRYNKAYTVLIARVIDISLSAFIWRDYDITISAQCGLAMRRPNPPLWARALNAFLNALERGHCELAICADIERAQAAQVILGSFDIARQRLKDLYGVNV
jgi:hypothetical protein